MYAQCREQKREVQDGSSSCKKLPEERQGAKSRANYRNNVAAQRLQESVSESWGQVSEVAKCSTSKNMEQSCIGTAATREGRRTWKSSNVLATKCKLARAKKRLEQEEQRRNAACVEVYIDQGSQLENMQRPRQL